MLLEKAKYRSLRLGRGNDTRPILFYIPPAPPVGGGEIVKDFGDGEKNVRGKKRKFGENITFGSTKP